MIIQADCARLPHRQASSDASLVKALGRAFRWRRLLESGAYATVREISEAESVNPSYCSRILRLTLLSPMIVHSILDGRLSAPQSRALHKPFPIDWDGQSKRLLGKT